MPYAALVPQPTAAGRGTRRTPPPHPERIDTAMSTNDDRPQCTHGYYLTDSCPGCDADEENAE